MNIKKIQASILVATLLGACGTSSPQAPTPDPAKPNPTPGTPGTPVTPGTPDTPVTTKTVNARVLLFNGDPAVGVPVQLDDASGAAPRPLQITDSAGTATFPNVVSPYTISAVPATGFMPITWTGVTRADPKVVIRSVAPESNCPAIKDGTLNLELSSPVGAGNVGKVYFIAAGISDSEIRSNAVLDPIPAGANLVSIKVPFSPALCPASVSGKLLYLEKNASGAYVSVGSANATVNPGGTTPSTGNLKIASLTAVTQSLSGSVELPSGGGGSAVNVIIKSGGASLVLDSQPISGNAPTYSFVVPTLPAGFSYRSWAVTQDAYSVGWAYSDELSSLPATANLRVPNGGGPIQPAGAIGGNTTPTFISTPVTGSNLYFTTLTGTAAYWMGASSTTTIKLPALPAPARLEAGTAAKPGEYSWSAFLALNVRGGGLSDTMLDGRMIGKSYTEFDAYEYPDEISSGNLNINVAKITLP